MSENRTRIYSLHAASVNLKGLTEQLIREGFTEMQEWRNNHLEDACDWDQELSVQQLSDLHGAIAKVTEIARTLGLGDDYCECGAC